MVNFEKRLTPKTELHIDIETYSSTAIKLGHFKYAESEDFEILLFAYAFNDEPVKCVDLLSGEKIPSRVIKALTNPKIIKIAHNAAFEKNCLRIAGFNIVEDQWFCSQVKAAYCGWPLSLGKISEAMQLGTFGKSSEGRALIRYFCMPCKPTITNGGRTRNYPYHNLEKWKRFIQYCIQDVVAERHICGILKPFKIPYFERELYLLDQKINQLGVRVDTQMAANAIKIDNTIKERLLLRIKNLTGIEKPNSGKALKAWLKKMLGREIESLSAKELPKVLASITDPTVLEVLELKQRASRTSTTKYKTVINCVGKDQRIRGLLQFYGANRTGRWAGRLLQVQNLKRNYINNLDEMRTLVKDGNLENIELFYDDVSDILSQLIRTTIIPAKGKTFAVADFSAIEARVLAWLANEQWRLDVFNTHGKIYEASASKMFSVPIEQITKTSDYRYKGKVAELALGYQGAVGALKIMGAEKMGLSETEMENIKIAWRKANRKIVQLWHEVEKLCLKAVLNKNRVFKTESGFLKFCYDGKYLKIKLPSGRLLFYIDPQIGTGKFGKPALTYMGVDQFTKKWVRLDTYGGKLIENICQAVARDLLAESMIRLDNKNYVLSMHVHDEVLAEVPIKNGEKTLKNICAIMGECVSWAPGLPLCADGYLTPYYKKD